MKTTVYLYVEGGGDNNTLVSECRTSFKKFLERAGLNGMKASPKIRCYPRSKGHRGTAKKVNMTKENIHLIC
jgi:hypothetical protein